MLIDGDFSTSDSSVICAYLDEAYPQRPVLPADPKDRARARWLEEFADTRLGDLFIWGLFYQKIVHPARLGRAGRPGSASRRPSTEDAPAALDYLEGELPRERLAVRRFRPRRHRHRQLLPQRRLCRLRARRGPLAARRSLRRPSARARGLRLHPPFEDIQRSVDIKGRRQALLDAGAPLTDDTLGTPTRARA